MQKTNLNAAQQTAALHINGPMMVLAGPGSGKTATLVARAVHLVQAGIPPSDILVIAYSRAAATEMKGRFASRFTTEGLDVPSVTFGTFHSVFYRMLREHNADNEQIIPEGERRNFVRLCLEKREYEADNDLLSAVLNEMSLIRNELFEPAYYHATSIGNTDFHVICEQYEAYKVSKRFIDFDDMLCRTHTLFKTDAKFLQRWRNRYTHIMIDEFQDINRVQYENVRLLAAPLNNLFIVGDDDQSIYRFRGSRPEFLLHFPQDFPGTQQVTLAVNYRSTDPIIRFANAVVAENEHRYPKDIIGTDRNGPTPTVLTAQDQNEEATKIGERIRKLIRSGTNPDEICIAFRLNMQARAFADAFLHQNIPYRTRDEMPILYEHWLAEDIFAYLRLGLRVQYDGFNPDAARIANKPYRFISKAFLEACRKHERDPLEAYPYDKSLHISQKTRLEELQTHIKQLRGKNSVDAIRYIRRFIGYNEHINDHCNYRKLDPTGLHELANELQEAAKAHPDPADFLAFADAAIAAKSQDAPTGPCVTLTTLHSAKGLEFRHVFIAGVVEDILPHIRSKTPAEIEEERRLLYVGITRAKHELFLSVPKTRYDKITEPSRFIKNFRE
ncbi:MAG: ATP-dependent helicase [Defluviitaleaceae bacterium]|nr:ATP-dependent helicase [Defluviitaleaceae bacterium]